jgi:hypothetical protein
MGRWHGVTIGHNLTDLSISTAPLLHVREPARLTPCACPGMFGMVTGIVNSRSLFSGNIQPISPLQALETVVFLKVFQSFFDSWPGELFEIKSLIRRHAFSIVMPFDVLYCIYYIILIEYRHHQMKDQTRRPINTRGGSILLVEEWLEKDIRSI